MGKKGLNIYHRKDGRWEGRYKDGFNADGKTKYRSVYAHSYGEIRDILIRIKSSESKPMSICSLTVEQLFDEWLTYKAHHVKESTIENYRFKIEKHLNPFFSKLKFNVLSPKIVYNFIQKKKNDGLSAKYISDMLVILKSMAKYTTKVYHCANEIADIEIPKVPKTELNIYSNEQQNTLKSELLRNTTITKIGILLCLFTGIRLGELCALKWLDIDLNNTILHISKTCQRIRSDGSTKLIITAPKSISSTRSIPLPSFLISILKDFAPSEPNAFFLSGADNPIEPRTMQYRFKAIIKKANLPSINFHSLRHMFAMNCIELGFDVKTLSEILGHGTVELTLNIFYFSLFYYCPGFRDTRYALTTEINF